MGKGTSWPQPTTRNQPTCETRSQRRSRLPEPIPGPIAERLFGRVNQYGFDERGPVSALWIANGPETGRFPELVEVFIEGTGKYIAFADGAMIYQPSPSEALQVMALAAELAGVV